MFRLRIGSSGQARTHTSLALDHSRARWLRVTISDEDDAPLKVTGASLRYFPDFALFEAAAGKTYQLAYGNELARPPHYDLEARLADQGDAAAASAATAGLFAQVENPSWRAPQAPLTERLPWLPDAAVGLGGLALVGVLYRVLRRPKPDPSAPA